MSNSFFSEGLLEFDTCGITAYISTFGIADTISQTFTASCTVVLVVLLYTVATF